MSFGSTLVDRFGPTERFPATSMITGLIGNALGWDHADADCLQRLQDRLRMAIRLDRPGVEVLDYQTVDLGQRQFAAPGRPARRGTSRLLEPRPGWTTRGTPEGRSGGDANVATHIRLRRYRADAACTVALTLTPTALSPGLSDLEAALSKPQRPLFLGRKACIPSAPLLIGRRSGASLVDVLADQPCDTRRVEAQWPCDDPGSGVTDAERVEVLSDTRDWRNQAHTGSRRVMRGWLRIRSV